MSLVPDPDPVDSPAATEAEPIQHHRSSLLRNIGALLGAQAVTWVITTAVMVVVPRIVGPEAIGQFRVAGSLWAVGGIFIGLGTAAVVTLEIARNQAIDSVRLGPVFLAQLGGYLLVLGPLAMFVAIVGYDSGVITLLVIGGVGVLIAIISGVARAALGGFERMGPVATADVASKTFGAIATLAVVVVTRNIFAVAVVAVLTSALLSALLLRSLAQRVRIDYRSTVAEARDVVRRGVPFFLIGVTAVVYVQIDVVVMSILVSDVEIGWYGTADTLFGTLLFIPTILMSSLFPVLVRTHEEDPAAAAQVMERVFRGLLLMGVPVGLGLLIVSSPLALALFGPKFDGTGPVLAVFGIVLIFTYQTVLLGTYSGAIGRPRLWNIVMLIAIPMTVVLDIVLVPWTSTAFDNGAIGGALAYVGTESMMVGVGIWKLAPQLVSRRTLTRVAKVAVAGGAMVAACWPLRDLFLAIPVTAGVLVYASVLLLTRPFDPNEIEAINRVRGRLPGPLRPR